MNTEGGNKIYWASDLTRKGERFSFRVVDRCGDQTDKVVLGMGDDLVSLKDAKLNLFFAAMQVV